MTGEDLMGLKFYNGLNMNLNSMSPPDQKFKNQNDLKQLDLDEDIAVTLQK